MAFAYHIPGILGAGVKDSRLLSTRSRVAEVLEYSFTF